MSGYLLGKNSAHLSNSQKSNLAVASLNTDASIIFFA